MFRHAEESGRRTQQLGPSIVYPSELTTRLQRIVVPQDGRQRARRVEEALYLQRSRDLAWEVLHSCGAAQIRRWAAASFPGGGSLVLRRDKSSRLEIAELSRSKKIVDFFSRRTFFTFRKSTIIFYG